MDELAFASAKELARRIQLREITSVELLDTYRSRINTYIPSLNVAFTVTEDEAWYRALQADADLARGRVWEPSYGVPRTLKDGHTVAGILRAAPQ